MVHFCHISSFFAHISPFQLLFFLEKIVFTFIYFYFHICIPPPPHAPVPELALADITLSQGGGDIFQYRNFCVLFILIVVYQMINER
jgi:hypothetical protein